VALEILGLDGLSESVYRALLADPDADLSAVARRLGVDEQQTRDALERLVGLSLVRERAGGRLYVPVNPEVTLDAMLALEQAELSRRERQLLQARAELARLVRTGDTQTGPVREVRRLDDLKQVIAVMRDLSARCYREVLSVTPGDLVPVEQIPEALEDDLALLDRGVRCRLLHTRRQLRSEPLRRHLATLRRHGAEVRISDTLPHRLLIFDRTVSFLPVDPQRVAGGALVVREPAIIANLVTLFESLWATAVDLDEALESGGKGASAFDRAVLMLMSSGVKDEAAARQLNVSDRTYRRHVADILTRLGASSRFQAGVEAVRRGWL
jgi:sugar-specific transcriptional regulator TrmB/DNA-binding CsgD family transcriptional regulator